MATIIKDAAIKIVKNAPDLKANAVLAQCSATAIALMQSLIDAGREHAHLLGVKEQATLDIGQCSDFGFTAVRDMRLEGMSYELIYDLHSVLAEGANKPNILKSAKSMLQSAETLGLKITATTSKGDCAKVIKAHKAKETQASDAKGTDNQQGTTDGELTDAQIVTQGLALLLVNADLRQMKRADLGRVMAKLAADDIAIARAKIAEGAKAAAKRKAA